MTNKETNPDSVSPLVVIRASDIESRMDTESIESFLRHKDFEKGKDLAFFAISHTARRAMPYGIWTCKDGREVVFNREYQPILQRKDGVVSYAERNEWITYVKTLYLYDDASSPFDYLTKHLGHGTVDAKHTKQCRKSLLICLKVLREFTPKESGSTNRRFSVAEQ